MQMFMIGTLRTYDVFEVVDDFGNLRDFGDEMTEQEVIDGAPICPVGVWFFTQGQPLADSWEDDVEQCGIQH